MLTKERFIRDYYKSRENSDYIVKYDFSLLPDIIPTRRTMVTVICLEEFSDGVVGECQTSYENLIGKKRDVLNYCSRKRRWTTEEFIQKVIEVQGEGVWDFSETVYIDKKHKVKVKCMKCGRTVELWPDDLSCKSKNLDKRFFGCKDCIKKAIKEENRIKNAKIFLERSKKLHGDAFDYSYVEEDYIDNRHPVRLICKKCGRVFNAIPSHHVRSKTNECPKCVSERVGIEQRLSKDEIIRRGIEIYGDIFDYSETIYSGVTKELTVIVKETGERLTTTADNFFKGSKFGKNHSCLELSTYKWLDDNKIEYKKEVYLKSDFFTNREFLRIDIVLEIEGKQYYIECNGEQHYKCKPEHGYFGNRNPEEIIETFKNQVQRDKELREYCRNNDIVLIEIPYTFESYNKINNALTEILLNHKQPGEVIKQPEIEIPV